MADLASLGVAVDSSQIVAADNALGSFAASGKNAQISADVLTAAAVRLGISVEEVQNRLDAANDNMAASAEQAMKLSDATKQASAANDNFSDSISSAGAASVDAGRGFFGTIEHVLNLTSHLKLLALGAYALFPAFRGIVNAGLSQALLQIIPAAGLATQALGAVIKVLSPMLSFFAGIGAPILLAVAAFELLSAIWTKGSDLLDKYANSLRSLYSPDTVQNLEKLTQGQQDIISAEQVARATELGARLQDAGFIIKQFLTTSIFDLTNVSLKLQTVWVNIVEVIAKAVQFLQSLPLDKISQAAAFAAKINPITGPVANAISNNNVAPAVDDSKSLDTATSRLSAMMGVAALASEALNKTQKAAGALDKEVSIGDTFIAKYSDDIKKLADGNTDADSWDRVTNSINKQTASLVANAASVGKTVEFQEQLRIETQLLNATKGSLNAATDDQIALYVKLRADGFTPLEAIMTSSIKLDKDKIQSLTDLSETAGEAKSKIEELAAAIAQAKALASDIIATQALTAYSAAQKGAIADAQKRLELQADLKKGTIDQEQVDERAASAAKLASATELKALSEAARARALAATETAKTTQVSIDAAGLSVGAAYKLTTIEQTRQQLEQDASVRHTTINQKELADLTAKINKTGDLKQVEAQAAAQRTADFDQQTALLSTVDQQIAAVQQKLHGDGWKAFMDDGLAAQMRLTDATKQLGSALESNITNSLTDIVSGTTSVSLGFQNMGNAIVKAIEQMIIKLLIVEPLMRSLQMGANALGFGDFSGAVNANGSISGAVGPTSVGGAPLVGLHSGGIVGSEATFSRYVHPSHFDDAVRMHTGGIAGNEVPIIAEQGEGVFTRGQMAALGGSKSSPNITINNHTEAKPQVSTNSNGDVTITLKKMIEGVATKSLSQGDGMRVLNKQYGVNQFTGQ